MARLRPLFGSIPATDRKEFDLLLESPNEAEPIGMIGQSASLSDADYESFKKYQEAVAESGKAILVRTPQAA